MPNLRKYLLEGGMKFTNGVVSSPKCCPSRTSALASRFAHNINDESEGWCGDFIAKRENSTFVKDIHDAGYATSFTGKYMNEEPKFCFGNVHVPVGYDDFFAMCEEVKYYDLDYNVNGKMVKTGNASTDYLTAVLGNHTVDWLTTAPTPFYAYVAPHAPHLPATPAPWYADAEVPAHAPRTPNWNVGMEDKHAQVADNAPMDPYFINASDTLYGDRLRALMSVDDLIGDIISTLESRGLLESTMIFYTADHGYHLGQFGLWCEKSQIYETDIHIPFIVRGPGVPANETSPFLVNPIDIGPTILELAGVTQPGQRTTDGRSIVPLLATTAAAPAWPRDRALIEYFGWTSQQPIDPCTTGPDGVPGVPCPPPAGSASGIIDSPSNTFTALRIINASMDFMYAEYRPPGAPLVPSSTNFTEVYNLTADPYQLQNLAGTLDPALLKQLSTELWAVATCQGDACP